MWKLTSLPLMYGLLRFGLYNILPKYSYLNIWNLCVQKEIAYKMVQIKSLAMHITNHKCLYNYSRKCTKYLRGTWPLLKMNDFWHKRKVDHFDPYNVLLAIARNIPVLLKTGFVLQGHIYTRSFSFVKLVNISLENLWKLTIYKSHGKSSKFLQMYYIH